MTTGVRTCGVAVVVAAVAWPGAASRAINATASCEALTSLAAPNATITRAEPIDAGQFSPGGGRPVNASRPFCRVAATLRPSPDSDIKIEVWMPAAGWNQRLQAVGNGAFSGAIAYPAMANALGRGYATASTDTGHAGGSASFALGHPEKAIDFGWRAVHEMTVIAKTIIGAYYASAPRFSYWNGCSAGGRQAMKEAQRFPADYDGIIAGAPGLDWTGRAAQALRVAQALQKDAAARLPAAKAGLVHAAVLQACDLADGVKDGLLAEPDRCAFDPAVLQCRGADDASCLTPAQVSTVRMLYSPRVNPRTRREITALAPGSELGWTDLGWTASARATALDQFRFLVYQDRQWDPASFDFDRDIVRAEETDHDTINALDANLAPFIDRGGKLLQYHGWSDPQISPASSVQYYERVAAALGGASRLQGSYRLFMVPGMGHCGGGEGPDTFDIVTALEQWVEQGRAPDRIIASHSTAGLVDRTRPLCPYPQVAAHDDAGSVDQAASFTCRAR